MDKKVFIVFFSANGATRLVADTIHEGFNKKDTAVSLHRLGILTDTDKLNADLRSAGARACLFIGSPVYRDGAVPAVMAFLEELPAVKGAAAVPFVTWGKACSGLALWQMGHALTDKGFTLAGAAKVLAEHSLMWRVKNPPGESHPDEEDLRRLLVMVDELCERFQSDRQRSIALEQLEYWPEGESDQIKKKISAPWMIVPKTVDQNACTQCGICEQECPVGSITLGPFPEFDRTCCDCFTCIRLCPEDAIEPKISMDQIESLVWERVNSIDERPRTQIFL
jgi:ferredoxin/flavodoxin